ncbi:MAG: DUF448 domain-containing protein [Bacilli bacterium]|jgi:predicted RNA-binding protein YlxR (DUF448 family)|nr:DUF448 domain-containing protein [Bacilli bacterium]
MKKPYPVKRMDVFTRRIYPKDELFRLVYQNGTLVWDSSYSLPGRGIYVSKDGQSLDLVLKRHSLKRYSKGADVSALEKELSEHAHRS